MGISMSVIAWLSDGLPIKMKVTFLVDFFSQYASWLLSLGLWKVSFDSDLLPNCWAIQRYFQRRFPVWLSDCKFQSKDLCIKRLHLLCKPQLGTVMEELPVAFCLQAEPWQTPVFSRRVQFLDQSHGPEALLFLHAIPMAYRIRRFLSVSYSEGNHI